jgi:hypothetical protein
MKKLSLIFVLALAVVAGVAQTPFTATYTFGTGGNVQSFVYNGTQYDGITMGNIDKVGQINSFDSPGNFRAYNWPSGSDYGKYIAFTISAKPGYKFTVSSITFGIGRDADGTIYTEWAGSNNYSGILNNYTLASGLGNMMGTITNPPNVAGSWTGNVLRLGTAYQNISTSCGFRMYMYGAQSASGTAGLQGPITITGSYTPSIEVSVSQLPHFTVQQSAGPSSPQSFTVSAVGLTPTYSLMIKAPDSYELALAESGPYSSGSGTFSVISDNNGNITNAPVYVRLRQGLYAGSYNGNVEVRYEVPEPDVVKLVAVTGTVTQAPEYYAAFEKTYEVLADYSATATTVPLGVNEVDGALVERLNWNMTQAKIGGDTGFVINGKRSARLRGCASSGMTMTQDKPNGGGLVSFCYRRYGSDTQVAWKVEYSLNQGPWTQLGSPFTAPASNEIQTFSGNINDSRPVRIRIVRADSSENPGNYPRQLNIDCIRITHYFDFPAGVAKTVGNNQITVTGGNANYNYAGTVSEIPNAANFTASFHHCLTLLGSGPWTFNVANTGANWIAYKQGDTWTASAMTNGSGSITVTAAKNTEIELLTGNGNDPTLPVTLSHFSATLTAQNYVQLTWISQTETNLLGYNVYRNSSPDLGSATKISELIEGTNTSSAQTYVYYDMELNQDGTYCYWLQNVDMDGTMGYHGPASVFFTVGGNGGAPAIPKFTRLENAYPNPFNPDTTIRYQLNNAGHVKIDIYDQRGRKVRSFERGHAAAGRYGLLWDGCDSSGKTLPSGVYLVKMGSGSYSGSKKVVLQK